MPSKLRIRISGFICLIWYSIVVCFSDLTVLSEVFTYQDVSLHDCVYILHTISY